MEGPPILLLVCIGALLCCASAACSPRSGGSRFLRIDADSWASPFFCGHIEELYKQIPEANITLVPPDALAGESFGRWLSEDMFLLVQEMFAARSTVFEVVILDDPWVEPVSEYLAEFSESELEEVQGLSSSLVYRGRGGGITAIPRVASMQVLVYRKDLFDKYQHSWPATWDEFDRVVQDIQDRERAAGNSGFYGFTIATDDSANRIVYTLISILTGDGGGGIVESNGTVSINNERAVRSLKRWKWWLDNVTPPAARGWGTSSALRHFLAGNSSVVMTWSSRHDELEEWQVEFRKKGWELGIVPIPGESAAGCSGSWYLSLSKYTRDIELGKLFVRAYTRALNNVSLNTKSIPPTSNFFSNPQWKAAYCSKWTVACESMAKYPDYWGRMSHRPSAGCGPLYPFCADIVYRSMDRLFRGDISAENAVASMERELQVLLGHWEPSWTPEDDNAWEWNRVILAVAATVGFISAIVAGLWVKVQMRLLRSTRGCSIPVSLLLALVVTVALVAVLPVVIILNDDTSSTISMDLATRIRSQALRGVQTTVETTIQGLLRQDRSWQQVRSTAIAGVKTYLGRMQLEPTSLVILLDRTTGEVLVSSNAAWQPTRMLASDPGLHPWLRAALEAIEQWQTNVEIHGDKGVTVKHDGSEVFVNAQSVMVGREAHTALTPIEIQWLILYHTPRKAVLHEANSSMNQVLDLSIILSILSLLLSIISAVVITAPLIRLAVDMEEARLLGEIEDTRQRSILTEVNSLIEAFYDMSIALNAYKAFIPRSVFVNEDTEDDDESAKVPLTRKKKALAKMRQKKQPFVRVRPLVERNYTAVFLRIHEFSLSMYNGLANSSSALEILQGIEALATAMRGNMLQMATISPGEILITWNADLITQSLEKAVKVACDALKVGKLMYHMTAAAANAKVRSGHIGTQHTRGFGVVGPLVSTLHVLVAVADDMKGIDGVVVTKRYFDRLKGILPGEPIDIVQISNQRTLVYLVQGEERQLPDHWLYSDTSDKLGLCMTKLLTKDMVPSEVVAKLRETPSTGIVEERLIRRLATCGDVTTYSRSLSRKMAPAEVAEGVMVMDPD